jgi:hypothetical protein
MKTLAQFREQAAFLRDSSGSTNIEKTLLKALRVLKTFNIPHYVCGGFAVQELGYPRFTVDVDLIVPDVDLAIEKLTMNGFRPNPGSAMTVTDRETKVEVDLLPGGKKIDPGPLVLPMPIQVSETPQILTLEKLISSKLSTYIRSRHRTEPRSSRRSEAHPSQQAPARLRRRRSSSRALSRDLGRASLEEVA